MKEFYGLLYAHKCDDLDETDQFLKRQSAKTHIRNRQCE